MAKAYTGTEFIAKARAKHNDQYDYSLVAYSSSQTKVLIVCRRHGAFEQTPAKHLSGQGCSACARTKRLTRDSFIARAADVHGNKYGYSQVAYQNNRTPVEIICPLHGTFSQSPGSHLAGHGCSRCAAIDRGVARRLTTRDYVEKAVAVHGTRYAYDDVEYVDSTAKVTIKCSEHGPFRQLPSVHLQGVGCPACGITSRAAASTGTTATFNRKAAAVHGERYDYSQVDYAKAATKVAIVCRRHGAFMQTPNSHLSGAGCPACAQEARTVSQTGTAERFVQQAYATHGTKYDYSELTYTNSQSKVTIVCRDHGPFAQTPGSHLQGNGCPTCGNALIAASKAGTTEEFIERALDVHGDKYDYAATRYERSWIKVVIGCRVHGAFAQTPNSHLSGRGCPGCGVQRIALARAGDSDSFLLRAAEVHGNRFDYADAVFAGSHTKMLINCRDHGGFRQTPASHLSGSGCPRCAVEVRKLAVSGTTERFISKALVVHGDRYDYTAVHYSDVQSPVRVGCRSHGTFNQLPPVHLGGSGCPRCSFSRGEAAIARCLSELDLDFECQWRDHDCRDRRVLPFDFALVADRILIEFDGEQHRSPVRWGSMSLAEAEECLRQVQRRDRIKDHWAASKSWSLLRFTDASTVANDLREALTALEVCALCPEDSPAIAELGAV